MTLVLHGPSTNPALPKISPEALANDINNELTTYWMPLNGDADVSGPISITASGGTVSRPIQDMMADIVNVLDHGADPTGAADSTTAFRSALATGRDVWAPRGRYLITGQLIMTTGSKAQTLSGEGHATVLLIDTRFDPAITTGVIVLTSDIAIADARPHLLNITMKFKQPTDIITTTMSPSAVGSNTITVTSTAGILVGMSVICQTHRSAIPTVAYTIANATATVTNITGNILTLSVAIAAPGVSSGDTVQFASVRSMFKTLAAGGTAGPGGTGIKYPWAIYSPSAETVLLQGVVIEDAWDGIYIRGSSYQIDKVDVGAFDIGLDIDQCYNFPTINDFRFWLWGFGSPTFNDRDAFSCVYYDGQTICANFGRADGLCAYNLQSWTGIVNLTPNCQGGYFLDLMMDGNNANLNVLCGGGLTQFTGGYSSKGSFSLGTPVTIDMATGAHVGFSNFSIGAAAGGHSGIVVRNGSAAFGDCQLWDGIQGTDEMFQVRNNATLALRDCRLDAGGGGVSNYVKLYDTATLHMSDCVMARNVAGLVDATYNLVTGTATTPAYLDNIFWNGWHNALTNVNGVLYARDFGVIPNATDNTAAIQAFFAALQAYPGAVKGVMPAGWINFKTPITAMNGKQHWSLEGAGISATWLNYTGTNSAVDLLKITGCSNFNMSGFVIDSATAMTAGTALHLDGCGSCWMLNLKIGGQSGAYHTGPDGNWHYNLWNGIWFDKTGIASLSNFELSGQNDACRVNGVLGSGAGNKADCFLSYGKIMGARVGVHIGGAYGGFCIDDVDVIGNWYNCVIDQALTAEINREIFFGDHAIFDSSGGVGTPTYPGPANPGGGAIGDNIVVDDPNGGFLVIRGWAVTAFQNGNCIHIKNWAGVVRIDGCLIAYAQADGIRIDTDVAQVIVTNGTNIHDVTGWGINKTTGVKPVLGAPTFTMTHTGDTSPTTKLTLPAKMISLALQNSITAAGTTQATATPITAAYVTVANVAAGSGVILPVVPDGTLIEVINVNGTNTPLTIYPPVGWSIFGTGSNIPIVIQSGFMGALIAKNSNTQYQPEYIGPMNTSTLVLFSPLDVTSIQTGAYSFNNLTASGHFSTGYGNLALYQHGSTGQYNTAFGGYAGFGVAGTSSGNTLVGALAGYCSGGSNLGSNNTFLGALTAYSMTTGANNTLIGYNAGNGLTTGSGNIFIGDGSGISFGSAIESNTLRIGTNTTSVIRATTMNTAAPKLFFDWLPASTSYASDAAAAAGGVQVGQIYRNGSAFMVRVA